MLIFLYTWFLMTQVYADCQPISQLTDIQSQIEFQKWAPDQKKWVKMTNPSCETLTNFDLNKFLLSIVKLKNLPSFEKTQGTWASDILSPTPYDFFKNRVKTIRIDNAGVASACESQSTKSTTIAFAESNQGQGTIHICPGINNNSFLQIMRDLLHEARHISDDGSKTIFSHTTCLHGGLQGNFGCDNAFSEEGSYAVGLEFLIKMSRSKLIDPEMRQLAHRLAFEEALLHFNYWPGEVQESLLLQSKSGDLYIVDSKTKKSSLIKSSIANNDIFTLRLSPTIFDLQKSTVKTYVGRDAQKNSIFVDTASTFADQFRKDLTTEEKAKLRDVFYGNEYVCFLFVDSLTCEAHKDDKALKLKFPENFIAEQFAFMNEPIGGFDLVHIVTQSGDLYMLPTNKSVLDWQFSDLTVTPTFHNFVSVAILSGLVRIALTREGKLVQYDNPSGPYTEVLKGSFKKMIAPFYWSPALDEI